MKSCILKNAHQDLLLSLIAHNLDALEKLVDYNVLQDIRLFRISSDLIPFGSSLAAELPWQRLYSEKLSSIGLKIIRAGLRVSMHPGQYTVLNSPDHSVAARAAQDLDYHAKVLDGLGLGTEHKIVLHLGGAYHDKKQALYRFILRYQELENAVRRRLVLENDSVSFNIGDVLSTASEAGIPVVYDNLHNADNPADAPLTDLEWIRQCAATWNKSDGLQKIHYAQQHRGKKPGAHSESIQIEPFLDFHEQLAGMNMDIMLEVKDKNLSALKCLNCVSNRGISRLEAEWARYKYYILERAPDIYQGIRQLLRDKTLYPALRMYQLIEEAADRPIDAGNAVNAAQHVWGYFKDRAAETERKRFQSILFKYQSGQADLQSVKKKLLGLAGKYQENYLLNGYYFYL